MNIEETGPITENDDPVGPETPDISETSNLPEADEVSVNEGFLSKIDWQIVRMVLAIKGAVLIFGVFCFQLLVDQRITTWHGYLDIWNRWDATRHTRLIESGYIGVGEFRGDLVGFPLWPWTVGAFKYFFQDTQLTAMIVAGMASIAAAILLYKSNAFGSDGVGRTQFCLVSFDFPDQLFSPYQLQREFVYCPYLR